jgi:hypothetical protein
LQQQQQQREEEEVGEDDGLLVDTTAAGAAGAPGLVDSFTFDCPALRERAVRSGGSGCPWDSDADCLSDADAAGASLRTTACHECGAAVEAVDWQAHADYHLALRLQKEERHAAAAAATAAAAPAGQGRTGGIGPQAPAGVAVGQGRGRGRRGMQPSTGRSGRAGGGLPQPTLLDRFLRKGT